MAYLKNIEIENITQHFNEIIDKCIDPLLRLQINIDKLQDSTQLKSLIQASLEELKDLIGKNLNKSLSSIDKNIIEDMACILINEYILSTFSDNKTRKNLIENIKDVEAFKELFLYEIELNTSNTKLPIKKNLNDLADILIDQTKIVERRLVNTEWEKLTKYSDKKNLNKDYLLYWTHLQKKIFYFHKKTIW